MNFTRRVGWTVMKDKHRRSRARFLYAMIEPHLVPGRQLFRLALRQFGLHGKICFGKIQRTLQVARFRHLIVGIKPFY